MVENFDIKNQALSLKKTENHCPRALLFQVKNLAGELLPSERVTGAFEKLRKYSYSLHTQKGYTQTPTHSFVYNFRKFTDILSPHIPQAICRSEFGHRPVVESELLPA